MRLIYDVTYSATVISTLLPSTNNPDFDTVPSAGLGYKLRDSGGLLGTFCKSATCFTLTLHLTESLFDRLACKSVYVLFCFVCFCSRVEFLNATKAIQSDTRPAGVAVSVRGVPAFPIKGQRN